MQDGAALEVAEDVAQIVLAGARTGQRGSGYDAVLRRGLQAALDGAFSGAARAVVIRAGAGGWPVAADPATDYAHDPEAPDLAGITERIAAAPVPVTVILDGLVAGGAFALAQAAQIRVARPGTRFAAPEFGLGMVPGAGGLVRFARRAGAAAAVDYVTGGRVLQAEAALRIGLCDHVLDGDLPYGITGLAAGAGVADPKIYMDGLASARAEIAAGPLAPVARRVCDVVEAALLLPPGEAQTFERVACEELEASELARALRHVLLARRRAMQLAGVVAQGGLPQRVALWNPSDRLVLALLDLGVAVQVGASDPPRSAAIVRAANGVGQIAPVAAVTDFTGADILVAAPRPGEMMALRQHLPEGAVLALETVRIREGEYGFARLPGLAEVHAAEGAETAGLGRLAAVLRAERDVVIHAEGLAAALEASYWLAAERAVMAGARPATVDAALTSWGFAEGPFARLDRRGLPAAFARFSRGEGRGGPYLTWLGLEGRTGRAAGHGVWRYEGGTPRIWAEEEAELTALRREAGVEPAVIPAFAIVERVVAELARTGAQLLQDGRVHRASDVDLVAIAGLGFPRHRGGPLFQADWLGLPRMRQKLRDLIPEGAPEPGTLWDVLIRNDRRFADLDG